VRCGSSGCDGPSARAHSGGYIAKALMTLPTAAKVAHAFLHSGQLSIDTFLSKRGDEFSETGKWAIAAALCIRETPTMVMNATIEGDWYAYLWSVMSGTLSKVDDVPFEKIKIITFNYDRSLEYFFMRRSATRSNSVSMKDSSNSAA
jgi:hypothetical protein